MASLMSLPRLVMLLGGILAILVVPASSGAQQLRSCGGGVRAALIDCGKAKRIAAEYRKTHSRSIWLYTCSGGRERGRCVLERKIVIFPLG
jgi:hypothetical protein